MATQAIRFNDGDAYEKMMGIWSRLVGEAFLDWLAPATGLVWTDIGCGSGAFSQLLVDRCAPARIHGIDPAEAQLVFARQRPAASVAEFRQGDAQALPYADNSLDAAAMALVLFFVPNPTKGVAEMVRVVKPGGSVSAYMWDSLGGGNPAEPVMAVMRAMGFTPASAPNPAVSRLDAMTGLWENAGLRAVETRVIRAERRFADFEEFWAVTTLAPNIPPVLALMSVAEITALRERVRANLPVADGGITATAVAHAIKGYVPLPG